MLYLASASPRRRELLTQAGFSFSVLPTNADESLPAGATPREAVGILARRKAEAAVRMEEYRRQTAPGDVILAADTVVDLGGIIFGKPDSREDAPSPASGTACTPASACSREKNACAGWNPPRWSSIRSRTGKSRTIWKPASRWTRRALTASRDAA